MITHYITHMVFLLAELILPYPFFCAGVKLINFIYSFFINPGHSSGCAIKKARPLLTLPVVCDVNKFISGVNLSFQQENKSVPFLLFIKWALFPLAPYFTLVTNHNPRAPLPELHSAIVNPHPPYY